MLLGGDYTVHNNSAIHAASAASRSRPACHHALAASASAAESAAFASRCVAASVAQSRAAADAAQRVRGIGVRGRGGRAGVQQRCASASAGRVPGRDGHGTVQTITFKREQKIVQGPPPSPFMRSRRSRRSEARAVTCRVHPAQVMTVA